jgi:hypothetical protein
MEVCICSRDFNKVCIVRTFKLKFDKLPLLVQDKLMWYGGADDDSTSNEQNNNDTNFY